MKTCSWLCAVIFIALTGLARAEAPKAVQEDPEFVEARRLFWSGKYEDAEKKFKIYLIGHPKHEASQSFLLMIKQSRIHNPSKIEETRRRLGETKVDRVSFEAAEWKKVSDYFVKLANEKKEGDYINFINLLPSNYSRKVTLELTDVTLLRAIEIACEQAGFTYVIDTNAVIVELPQKK